jgi:hypothetical protein
VRNKPDNENNKTRLVRRIAASAQGDAGGATGSPRILCRNDVEPVQVVFRRRHTYPILRLLKGRGLGRASDFGSAASSSLAWRVGISFWTGHSLWRTLNKRNGAGTALEENSYWKNRMRRSEETVLPINRRASLGTAAGRWWRIRIQWPGEAEEKGREDSAASIDATGAAARTKAGIATPSRAVASIAEPGA